MRISDWSSDVCSSDLGSGGQRERSMDGWPCADGGRDEIFWDFAGRLRSGTNVNARLGDGAVTEGKADNRFRTNEIHAPAMRCGGKQFLSPGNMAANNKAVIEGEFIMR